MKLLIWAIATLTILAAPVYAQTLQEEPSLKISILEDGRIQIVWPGNAEDFGLESATSLSVPTLWEPVAVQPVVSGNERIVTISANQHIQFLRLSGVGPKTLTTITSSSPANGEMGVSVTRETILHFSAPLSPAAVLTTSNFYATFGGRKILSRVEMASDRKKASLFYLEPLPGSARIGVFFNANGVLDATGVAVDADSDGKPGGLNVISFDTLSLTELPGTAIVGTVYASELEPGDGVGAPMNKPLEGVTITVDGREQELRAVTDASGKFVLSPVPPGRFFVKIDGRTARESSYPSGSYYPYVGKNWEAVAGKTNNLAGGTGEIYLPLIRAATLQPVSATKDTVMSFPADVIESNPALAGTSITIPANSLFSDDGTRGGRVGLAPVPPNRLPGPLPPGAELPLVITVQTDGPLNFDRPAPVCFPNLPNPTTGRAWPAGTKGSLISFNHKKGVWEDVGDMTVSADGSLFCTDPGVGIIQPGWHGVQVPKAKKSPPPPSDCLIMGNLPPGANKIQICGQFCDTFLNLDLGILETSAIAAKDICEAIRNVGSPQAVENCYNDTWLAANQKRAQIYQENADCKGRCVRCFGGANAGGKVSASAVDPIKQQLMVIAHQIEELLRPFATNRSTIPGEIFTQLEALGTQANQVAGGDAAEYIRNLRIAAEEELLREGEKLDARPDDQRHGNPPAYPVYYMARVLRPSGIIFLRGETEAYGQYTLFTPPDGELLDVRFYDPKANSFSIITPNISPKARYDLPRFSLSPLSIAQPDFDNDGLADIAEEVYGTDWTRSDSDSDGIPDGAELNQGTNPLDGLVAKTGVVGTVKTPGAAWDIATGNNLAVTAERQSGVSVISISDPRRPLVLLHVDTPGDAQRVAFAGDLVAVADGTAGLAVIDVSDPVRARIVRQVNLPSSQAVAVGESLAYVGSASGQIAIVDLRSGFVLDKLSITNAVQDLALEGDYLFALTGDRLHVLSIANATLTYVASESSPFVAAPNNRLFVGGGTAYTVHRKGYNTLRVADPTRPLLLTSGDTAQFGWRQIVANGSGLGLAAVGPNSTDDGPHDVSIYDLSNSNINDVVITTFQTPGLARAVSIYNGLGYVADDYAGVQVVNYLPYDSQKFAPTISLAASYTIAGIEEGKQAWINAAVSDDVQVRNVEFYLDGELAYVDGAFPFEFRFVTPVIETNKPSFTVRARAVDTGGNFAWSEEFRVPLTPDATPPRVVKVAPLSGDRHVSSVLAFFNEPLDPNTIHTISFRVFGEGTDGTLGTHDDVPVAGGTASYIEESRLARLDFDAPLPLGNYVAMISPEISDVAGNTMAGGHSWQFRVTDAVFWTSSNDGFWDQASNWNTGVVPGANDDVIIDASAPVTVTIRGTARARNISLRNRLALNGGTLIGASIYRLGAGEIRFAAAVSTFDGVDVDGDIILRTDEKLRIVNGLRLTTGSVPGGMVRLGDRAILGFEGNQSFGPATVVCEGSVTSIIGLGANTTLTLNNGTLIRGKFGTLGQPIYSGTGVQKLINNGIIHADVAGGLFTINAEEFENNGSVKNSGGQLQIIPANWINNPDGELVTLPGGSLTLNGRWSNLGTIRVNGGALTLEHPDSAILTAAKLGTLERTGGAVNLGCVYDNTGGKLLLNDSTGPWILRGGTIRGGEVTQTGAGRLIPSSTLSTLDGVTLEGDLNLNDDAQVRVVNGLKLITNGSPGGFIRISSRGILGFEGNQIFGPGTIEFNGSSTGILGLGPNTTLTLTEEVLIRGRSGSIGQPIYSGTGVQKLINNGIIHADVAGGTLTVNPEQFVNNGSAIASNGGRIITP